MYEFSMCNALTHTYTFSLARVYTVGVGKIAINLNNTRFVYIFLVFNPELYLISISEFATQKFLERKGRSWLQLI